ncbi:hypothetical protein FisN_8Lh291 [Fistulifera solaris]|uniref:RRM domain-containing protein n=1 Tax=Fistulifera solaris TaxID=1519565 RepID=A0A1Z5JN18_FISSO|nr:hypothetical protein FisN_8Lh291 [Fistulifera solaris]|eukprot:GAX15413.1 hypothetical protein FisN_8Lh291 [Fistulifera solaris]
MSSEQEEYSAARKQFCKESSSSSQSVGGEKINSARLWEESLGIDDHSSMHNSFRSHRTDVTGVSGLTMSSAFGSIPLQPGEMMEPYERPLSAPPPPGFSGGAEERTRKAELALRQSQPKPDEDSYGSSKDKNHGFGNLADYLGAGLAQSMEDAAREVSESKDDINFHRQTRHAANRLVGTTDASAMKHTSNSLKDDFAAAPSSSSLGGNLDRGFPSLLSTPQRKSDGNDNFDTLSGATASHPMFDQRSRLNGIGTNVSEPEEEGLFGRSVSGVVSMRVDYPHIGSEYTFDRPMLSSAAREFQPSMTGDIPLSASNDSNHSTDLSSRQAEMELASFLWDPSQKGPSRTLAILHVSWLRVPDVRSACETFGILETFRSEFSSLGIYLVSYYDIRSAQYASAELQAILQRLVVMQRGSEEVVVKFCIPLNSSSQNDDSQIVISDLPLEYDEFALRSILSSFGSIRSIGSQGMGSYMVEFNNIQDAKQAQLELDSTQPFGANTFVELSMRSPGIRKRGRELLSLLSRWRQMNTRRQPSRTSDAQSVGSGHSNPGDPWRGKANNPFFQGSTEVVGMGAAYGASRTSNPHQEATQVVLGPDGRYTPVVMQSNFSSFAPMGATAIDPRQQQIIQGPDGQMYLAPVPAPQSSHSFGGHGMQIQGSRYPYPANVLAHQDRRPPPQSRTPYYSHVVNDASSLSGRSHRSGYSNGTDAERDTRHLVLDLDAVEGGLDTRTSLMVRNIPNKYTQNMLLSEFAENGHGPGVIDFFYLPIDFKNRCNRGYAFINFIDYRDILAFHKQYYGKHWRTFNSDKICDVTYARIQGKAAMLKRFENSALMEKDEEYKPLVFSSSGPDKGQRLPFPDPSTRA